MEMSPGALSSSTTLSMAARSGMNASAPTIAESCEFTQRITDSASATTPMSGVRKSSSGKSEKKK